MIKIGRNDPCPCGSGKKYKKCHPGEYEPAAVLARQLPDWPVFDCMINDNFQEMGLATVIVVRRAPDNDQLVMALFLCDIFCLGVKNIIFEPYSDIKRLSNIIEAQPQLMSPFNYESARDLILGSVDYAECLGFEPMGEYEIAKIMIEADKPFNRHRFEYGRNGQPFYFTGPNDDYDKVFKTLERTCGKGNFDYEIHEKAPYLYNPDTLKP